MPRNGSGTYVLPAGQPVVAGTVIDSTIFNALTADLTTALTNSLAKNGETTPSANLPMGGFKHTGVADATSRNQYASAGQAQDSSTQLLSGVAGVDTITGTLTPAITAYAAGQRFTFVPAGTNTSAATINVNGLGAKSIVKGVTGVALVAGDLVATAPFTIVYNGTSFFLQSAASGANPSASVGLAAVNGTASTFMRSDGAPALSVAIAPTWTSEHRFSGSLTGGSFTAMNGISASLSGGTDPVFWFRRSGSALDEKNWAMLFGAARFDFFAYDDTGGNSRAVMSATRTANAITDVSFGNATNNPTYTFTGTGTFTFNGGMVGTGATGGAQGAGTINVVNAFINGETIRSIPQNSKSAAYTTVAADANKHIYHPSADTTARVWTIDSNANVPYPIGTAITFVNDTSGGVITIAITSDTLVLAGAGTTGSRTLAANGIATALKITSTRWQISGTNLT